MGMGRISQLIIEKFEGISTLISSEKLPNYIFRSVVNFDLGIKIGSLIKRWRYKIEKATAGTIIKTMTEFVDKNKGRQLIIKDSDGLKELVYSGGVYGNATPPVNDERSAATMSSFLGYIWNFVMRSGGGEEAGDNPVHYSYENERKRFPSKTNPTGDVTFPAGKYLEDQFYEVGADEFIKFCHLGYARWGTGYLMQPPNLTAAWRSFYVAYRIDGYQYCFPITGGFASPWLFFYQAMTLSLHYEIEIAVSSDYKRITDIYIFLSEFTGGSFHNSTVEVMRQINPAYILDHFKLHENQKPFFSRNYGQTYAASKTLVMTSADTWLTFEATHLWIYDEDLDKNYFVDHWSYSGTTVTFHLDDTIGDTVTDYANLLDNFYHFYCGWFKDGTSYKITSFYENYYKKYGAEMYSYLNLPAGDEGLPDKRYTIGDITAGRSLILSQDGSGYFSLANMPDVIPSLYRIEFQKIPVSVVGIGTDFYIFFKNYLNRLLILSVSDIRNEDHFMNVGLVNPRAVHKISDDELVFVSRQGIYLIINRQVMSIGDDLNDWFMKYLTTAQLNTCFIGYNYLREQIWICVPDFTGTVDGWTYSNGVIFNFDRKAARRGYQSSWTYISLGIKLTDFELNDDMQLLACSAVDIVNFNGTTQDESCGAGVKLKLLKSYTKRQKAIFKQLYIDCEGMITTPALNSDNEVYINQKASEYDVEITASSNTSELEIKKIILDIEQQEL